MKFLSAILSLLITIVVLASCGKELSVEPPLGPTDTIPTFKNSFYGWIETYFYGGDSLSDKRTFTIDSVNKTILVYDSIRSLPVFDISYDNQWRMKVAKSYDTSGGMSLDTFYRNTTGQLISHVSYQQGVLSHRASVTVTEFADSIRYAAKRS
ncbi:MAG: hypothetical protein H7Y27_16565, partial [Gemmatimonadaceae bacterium]|nr:hypothetical protein [Chitinophagaceae bacterium]